jgi:hypothetical protein
MTRRRWLCFCRGSALAFFWLRRIGMMADHRHHGEGEHHHGHVAMPATPGSALVVIEPELVFGGLKTVLYRPAMAFDRDQRFNGCSCWAPGGEEGEVTTAMRRRVSRPRVHKPSFALLNCTASRSASSIWHALDETLPIPDDATDIHFVVQDAIAALGIAVDCAETPIATARRRDAILI